MKLIHLLALLLHSHWAFALAMVHNVVGGGLALSDRATKAVFALSNLIFFQPELWQDEPFAALTHSNHSKEEKAKVEDSIAAMDWDERGASTFFIIATRVFLNFFILIFTSLEFLLHLPHLIMQLEHRLGHEVCG